MIVLLGAGPIVSGVVVLKVVAINALAVGCFGYVLVVAVLIAATAALLRGQRTASGHGGYGHYPNEIESELTKLLHRKRESGGKGWAKQSS